MIALPSPAFAARTAIEDGRLLPLFSLEGQLESEESLGHDFGEDPEETPWLSAYANALARHAAEQLALSPQSPALARLAEAIHPLPAPHFGDAVASFASHRQTTGNALTRPRGSDAVMDELVVHLAGIENREREAMLDLLRREEASFSSETAILLENLSRQVQDFPETFALPPVTHPSVETPSPALSQPALSQPALSQPALSMEGVMDALRNRRGKSGGETPNAENASSPGTPVLPRGKMP
jgi:hypothetical protein